MSYRKHQTLIHDPRFPERQPWLLATSGNGPRAMIIGCGWRRSGISPSTLRQDMCFCIRGSRGHRSLVILKGFCGELSRGSMAIKSSEVEPSIEPALHGKSAGSMLVRVFNPSVTGGSMCTYTHTVVLTVVPCKNRRRCHSCIRRPNSLRLSHDV